MSVHVSIRMPSTIGKAVRHDLVTDARSEAVIQGWGMNTEEHFIHPLTVGQSRSCKAGDVLLHKNLTTKLLTRVKVNRLYNEQEFAALQVAFGPIHIGDFQFVRGVEVERMP
jgi:hypothetical protein